MLLFQLSFGLWHDMFVDRLQGATFQVFIQLVQPKNKCPKKHEIVKYVHICFWFPYMWYAKHRSKQCTWSDSPCSHKTHWRDIKQKQNHFTTGTLLVQKTAFLRSRRTYSSPNKGQFFLATLHARRWLHCSDATKSLCNWALFGGKKKSLQD